MKLKLATIIRTIFFVTILQSCTVSNPYEPVPIPITTTPGTTTPLGSDDDDDDNGTTPTTPTTPTVTPGNTGGTSSANGGNKSHKVGQNCMNCHNPGGSGSSEGVWQVAGTVYDQTGTSASPNGTIQFWTGPNGTGTLKYTMEVDAKGNFYTSGSIVLTAGLYPAVTGAKSTKFMSSPATTGACNSCHTGTSTARVWTN